MQPVGVFKEVRTCLIMSTVMPLMYSLFRQHPEEGLKGGIIATVANGTHAAD